MHILYIGLEESLCAHIHGPSMNTVIWLITRLYNVFERKLSLNLWIKVADLAFVVT